MYVAAKLLVDGWRLVYSGNARCYHSHNYTIREEFSRYFDMGVFHAREPWIRNTFGGAGGEGFRFVKSELRFLSIGNISLWPISIMRNFFKLIGFKLGLNEAKLNTKLKRFLGMHKRYWDAPENL
jgi:rhamnosyltransferase